MEEGGKDPFEISQTLQTMIPAAANERENFQFSKAHEKTDVETVARTAKDLSQFSQTLQATTESSAPETSIKVADDKLPERVLWVLNAPEPPGLWCRMQNAITENFFPLESKFQCPKEGRMFKTLESIFPILSWGKKYNKKMFRNDLLAGLTLASLCIPQVSRF